MKNENNKIQADGTLNEIQVNCLASLLKYLRNEGDNMDKSGQFDKSVRYFDLADSLDIAVFALSQKKANPKQIALINRYVSSIK